MHNDLKILAFYYLASILLNRIYIYTHNLHTYINTYIIYLKYTGIFFSNRFTQMPLSQWHLISFFKTVSPYTFSLIFLPCCIFLHDMNNYLMIPSAFVGHWFQKPLQIPKSANAQVFYIKWHSTVSPPCAQAKPMDLKNRLYFSALFLIWEKKMATHSNTLAWKNPQT